MKISKKNIYLSSRRSAIPRNGSGSLSFDAYCRKDGKASEAD